LKAERPLLRASTALSSFILKGIESLNSTFMVVFIIYVSSSKELKEYVDRECLLHSPDCFILKGIESYASTNGVKPVSLRFHPQRNWKLRFIALINSTPSCFILKGIERL